MAHVGISSSQDARAATRRRWWVLGNVVALMVIFCWVRSYYSAADSPFGLTAEQWEQMQHLAMDQNRKALAFDLKAFSKDALVLASNETMLLELEQEHPQLMMNMLRATIYLQKAFNKISPDLGLPAPLPLGD